MMKPNETLTFSSGVSALLTYYKVKDDIADSGFLGGLAKRIFLLPHAARMRKRAIRRIPSLSELDTRYNELISRLSSLEKERLASADIPASLFGEMLACTLSHSLEGNEKRIAENIGRSVGKWIYIADALDDMESDLKSGNYNPLIEIYGGKIPTVEQIEDVAAALKNELFGAERAIELIDFEGYETVKNILFNILYLGMPKRIDAIKEKLSGKVF